MSIFKVQATLWKKRIERDRDQEVYYEIGPSTYDREVTLLKYQHDCLNKPELLQQQFASQYKWGKSPGVPPLDKELQAINNSWEKEN